MVMLKILKYNKRIFVHEYISNDDEWFHELGKWWVDKRSQEFHISKNAKCNCYIYRR